MSTPDITEIKQELRDVVKVSQATQLTLVEILSELRVVKPRVEKLEARVETLHESNLKMRGILALITFLGAPATAGIVLFIAKH
ncbi:hypothetical protein [Rhizobacter sp. Root404]|uniref:hypothetical protein n=1 Tax=Rhizobacter sp. Root404 TaxID=1736528 RepID=UPI0007017DDD|nr:hypothetical protein [Rhizobacter sp. Root404]KQW36762.1 hypothetical protein ASC76_19185 [Rhizobacter sp. Root404]